MEQLRECWRFDISQYKRLTEQEITNLNIKRPSRLQESTETSVKDVIVAATELRNKLQERDQGVLDDILEQLKSKGLGNSFKVWKLPIGRYGNMNGNKRIYPLKLWQNVKNLQADTWRGMCGLADHPEKDNDPGEFKNQAIIWHDMDVPETGGTVFGYGSFVGPHGHLAQEILEHGGRIGTSSSGFGDVDPITKTVDPASYIIERLADLVLNPSQGTFGGPDSPHTAGEFMKDVHQGATIEFEKQRSMKEAASHILRSKSMSEQMKYDAATAAQNGAPQGSAPAATNGAEELKESKIKTNILSKVEEKAFRKYVESFIADAKNIDNPIKRLNECVDILGCFDEGNCPDLKESLEKQLLEEKANLEKIVETVVDTEKTYSMDISKFREAAERNTAQGLLLKEQVTDYKELCDGLAKRNMQLKEENDKLKKMITIKDRLAEKKIMQSNKYTVESSEAIKQLEEKVKVLSGKNTHLVERVSKLSLSNKEFEKENDILTSKIKEAGSIMKDIKVQDKITESDTSKKDALIAKLQERIQKQESVINEIENNYNAQSQRFDKLQESFDNYKQEVNDKYNPVAHMMPKFDERVGKYLNLREAKGIEIETYWADLKEKYGDSVDAFEDKIRGAKTLKEATSNFLKYRTQIDSDFAVAQPSEYAYRNKSERSRLYEHQGIINPDVEYANSSMEQKNEEFLKNLKASGQY